MDFIDEFALGIYFFLDLIGVLPSNKISRPRYREDLYFDDLWFRTHMDFAELFKHPCADTALRVILWCFILWIHYPDAVYE